MYRIFAKIFKLMSVEKKKNRLITLSITLYNKYKNVSVTGVNIHVVTPFVCVVCIFYTCVVSQKTNINIFKNAELILVIFTIYILLFEKITGWLTRSGMDRFRSDIHHVRCYATDHDKRNYGSRWFVHCFAKKSRFW